LGIDFGNVNLAAVFLAECPKTQRLYAYKEYRPARGRTVAEHCYYLMKGMDRPFNTAIGGSWSEDEWRDDFAKGGITYEIPNFPSGIRVSGIHIRRPHQASVDVGIETVGAAFRNKELFIFDTCPQLIEELNTYSYELDDSGEPLDKIEDKETFHGCDSLRYGVGYLKRGRKHLNVW
jgi:hypothetical protein